MTSPRPFNEIKLQWLALLSQDKELSSTAIVVALYIITVHYNQERGKAWPSYETIAQATGKTAKTVQRAIKELEKFWLSVKRGNGLGHSTEFAPSQKSIIAATELREKNDKIVTLRLPKGGQKRSGRVTDLSSKGRQICHPKKAIESNNEERGRGAGSRIKRFPRIFVEADSPQFMAWNNWLPQVGFSKIEALLPIETRYGVAGCCLPDRYPPKDQTEWPELIKHLETLSRKFHSINQTRLAI